MKIFCNKTMFNEHKIIKMNPNDFQKIVHINLLYDNKILLSQRLKKGFHFGYWQDPGGKVENGEDLSVAAQRETYEETGLLFTLGRFNLVDCFVYTQRQLKTFLFETLLMESEVKQIKNTEPHKQTNWQWFTKEEALKLQLMPSVKHFLERYVRFN